MTEEHKMDLTSYYLKTPQEAAISWLLEIEDVPDPADEDYWAIMEAVIGEYLILPWEADA